MQDDRIITKLWSSTRTSQMSATLANALCIALVECSRVVALWLKSTHAGFSRDDSTTNHLASTKLVYRYCETYFSFHRIMERTASPCQWLRQLQQVKITVWGSTTVRLTVEPQHTLWKFVLTAEHVGLVLHQWLFIILCSRTMLFIFSL